jgi:hypothetical protein
VLVIKLSRLIKQIELFPVIAKVHVSIIIVFGLFLILAGALDLFGHPIFNIRAQGIFLGLIYLAQVLFYFIHPERWTSNG